MLYGSSVVGMLKRTNFSFAININWRLFLGCRWESHSSETLSGLNMSKLCACCHHIYKNICTSVLLFITYGIFYLFWVMYSLRLPESSFLFHIAPWAQRKGAWVGITFQNECSKITWSRHMIKIWVLIFLSINCKRKFLWWWLFMT